MRRHAARSYPSCFAASHGCPGSSRPPTPSRYAPTQVNTEQLLLSLIVCAVCALLNLVLLIRCLLLAGARVALNKTVGFCTSYSRSSCCDTAMDAVLKKRFEVMNVSDASCAGVVKSVRCAENSGGPLVNLDTWRYRWS